MPTRAQTYTERLTRKNKINPKHEDPEAQRLRAAEKASCDSTAAKMTALGFECTGQEIALAWRLGNAMNVVQLQAGERASASPMMVSLADSEEDKETPDIRNLMTLVGYARGLLAAHECKTLDEMATRFVCEGLYPAHIAYWDTDISYEDGEFDPARRATLPAVAEDPG